MFFFVLKITCQKKKNEKRSGLSELQIDNKSSSQFPEEKTEIELNLYMYMYVEPVERTMKNITIDSN